MLNEALSQAKAAKNDEFYTQWSDIEREVMAYIEYDPDVSRGKTVLCPCDDPEWSNFTKFFALHFAEWGLKNSLAQVMQLKARSTRRTTSLHYSERQAASTMRQRHGCGRRYSYWARSPVIAVHVKHLVTYFVTFLVA